MRCCLACSHDKRFVRIISRNALWLCGYFGFRESISAAGICLGIGSMDPPEGSSKVITEVKESDPRMLDDA